MTCAQFILLFLALTFCFNTQVVKGQEKHFENLIGRQAPTKNKVRFFLYTNPSKTNESQELFLEDTDGLANSDFISGAPLNVIIHGFFVNETLQFPQNVKNAYLNENNASVTRNILTVDWSDWTKPKRDVEKFNVFGLAYLYINAARSVPEVGAKVAQIISYFIDNKNLTLDQVHIVGHSLGAHVAGAVGNETAAKYGKNCPRITGLDPAGPGFYTNSIGRPLTKDDAKFVDVIHTDAFLLGKAGMIGHVDFFPNGGTLVQKECREIGNLILDIFSLGSVCSHSESHRLFTKSIGRSDIKGCRSDRFISDIHVCNEPVVEAIFGDNCSPESEEGKYYVDYGKYQ